MASEEEVLGVSTIGNATLVVYDGLPVLATDPWLEHPDGAYFGSWALEHAIPTDQERDVLRAPHIWYSHGHPDHLHPQTLERLRGKKILLPDHVGGRIRRDLEADGHDVSVLPDDEWVSLTPRVRIRCIANYIQDAILLIDVNGRLFVNLNDAASTQPSPRRGAKGCFDRLQQTIADYENSYLLRLSGWGDADMIHVFDETGAPINRPNRKRKIGADAASYAEALGVNHVIPFSSFHRYQRLDSLWANEYRPSAEEYRNGFREDRVRYLAPFCFVDCGNGDVSRLDAPPTSGAPRAPEEFGDGSSDPLDERDWRLIEDYFRRKALLQRDFRFLTFAVGGRERTVDLNPARRAGIRFESPRQSLVAAVRDEVFDNLLLANFTKATLYGATSLYAPNFTYAVAKYADNGLAETEEEVSQYLSEYADRGERSLRVDFLERRMADWATRHFVGTGLHTIARRVYQALRT